MRRTVLVPTMVTAARRARHMLLAMSLAALLGLALTLASPVAAQEDDTSVAQTVTEGRQATGEQEQSVRGSGQQAENEVQGDDERAAGRATGSLQGAEALIINGDSNGTADRIEIDAVGCEVEEKGVVVTVKDQDSESEESFTNSPDVAPDAGEVEATIEPVGDQVVIEVSDERFPAGFGPDGAKEEAGTVTSSTGVTCDRAAAANSENKDDEDENDEDITRTADELASLNCTELLVLFRSEGSSGQQYEDAAAFTDSAVRAQVEVCLKKEIVNAPDDNLPNTGGLSLLALAVLGVVSAAVGLSVIRGGQR